MQKDILGSQSEAFKDCRLSQIWVMNQTQIREKGLSTTRLSHRVSQNLQPRIFPPSLSVNYASRRRSSRSHRTGRNMSMKTYSPLLARTTSAKSQSPSRERLIGSDMRMRDIAIWSG